jgi:hypothetical protein
MNPFEMVVAIVAIGAVASVFRAKYGVTRGDGMRGRGRGRHMAEAFMAQQSANPDAERTGDEIKALKERIAVLERVITETNSAAALDREIEKLR